MRVKKEILKTKKWGITEETYRFYQKGFVSERADEMEFIRETNQKYHKVDAMELLDDYICLSVSSPEVESVCRFSVRQLYMEYQAHGLEHILALVDEHLTRMKHVMSHLPFGEMNDFDKAKEYLSVQPINYHDHQLELEDVHYKMCGDIALVVYMMFYENSPECGGFKLTKSMTKDWGICFEELFECALANTEKKSPAEVKRMVLGKQKKEIFYITNGNGRSGAIAMFYPSVQSLLADYLKEDFYVIFIGCGEVIVERIDELTPDEILTRMENVNQECGEEDLLSRDVFRYDVKERKIKVVGMIRK